MYTPEALLDVHARCHASLEKLLSHCGGLTEEELNRELPGFGYGSLRLQFHHVIGAERYWLGVLEGRMDADQDEDDYPTVDSLEAFRREISELTRRHLRGAAAEELNAPRVMTTWGGKEQELVPARVILRTQTHLFQHQGQITAMCRLLGRPVPAGLDFPIA